MNMFVFDQMVFVGGGNWCWWQVGWWDVVQFELGLVLCVIVGILVGVLMVCMLYVWNLVDLMDYYGEVLC